MQSKSKSKPIDRGVAARHDRRNRFVLTRFQDAHGFSVYTLENSPRAERIFIPKELFDAVRAALRNALVSTLTADQRQNYQFDVFFRTLPKYTISSQKSRPSELSIYEHSPRAASTGSICVSWDALGTLVDLLYSKKTEHANDLLSRIITYHKLFQFSFTDDSESMTSDLAMRKDVLTQVDRYLPSLAQKEIKPRSDDMDAKPKEIIVAQLADQSVKSRGYFKSRLAEKDSAKDYRVDYNKLFAKVEGRSPVKSPKSGDDKSKKQDPDQSTNCVSLPILAGDVKSLLSDTFVCEFTNEQMHHLRRVFLSDRDADFFVGFEIFDCIFKKGNLLKTFRFPLYYLPVRLAESGNKLILKANDNAVFLNHLALANAVETFSKGKKNFSPLNSFLKSLSNQIFDAGGMSGKINIMRRLPFSDEVFSRTREILIGFPGENGKGGLLGDLELSAIECDLEATSLYKSPKPLTPSVWSLENDLDSILNIALEEPNHFHESLLGNVFSPQGSPVKEQSSKFYDSIWCPGALPKCTRELVNRMNENDLVLLEGPPGTGKTHTITSLVIHCIAMGKRVLVVSDEKAAIHALTEQLLSYLADDNASAAENKNLEKLWRCAVKVIDEIPDSQMPLSQWTRQVRTMLGVEQTKEISWPKQSDSRVSKIKDIDHQIDGVTKQIEQYLQERFQIDEDRPGKVGSRKSRPKNASQARSLLAFGQVLQSTAKLAKSGKTFGELVNQFISDRDWMSRNSMDHCFALFDLPQDEHIEPALQRVQESRKWITNLAMVIPRDAQRFAKKLDGCPNSSLRKFLKAYWRKIFPRDASRANKWMRQFASLIKHPMDEILSHIKSNLENHLLVLESYDEIGAQSWDILKEIHDNIDPQTIEERSIFLELGYYLSRKTASGDDGNVQSLLVQIQTLYEKRDRIVRERFLGQLGEIGKRSFETVKKGGTDRLTSILAILDNLEAFESLASGWPVLRDLQKALYDTFPVWICRKRAVSFLFPCEQRNFDLIIVDEATQCRVDDALPLLFRADKIMAVGDERQTVLAKDSVLDDYLFRDFDLDEHLRTAQARGIKAGGSHLFGLVKRIKQASIMLDEHYRCAPDIIEYSNRYVYDNELRNMKWTMPGSPPSVIIDHSETKAEPSERQKTGKFRGVETQMVDRYLGFVAKTLKKIERETGIRIDTEKDVALCYFLLKNEPYVKEAKGAFLRKLNRGQDVLDGAGAALQGKERKFIFYLWDITRSNMMSFRQGDDPSKRKGELNVLMSRPKERAYHFLHRDFDQLSHSSSSITDFLWNKFYEQSKKSRRSKAIDYPLTLENEHTHASGLLIRTILEQLYSDVCYQNETNLLEENALFAVCVGEPSKTIDLMVLPREQRRQHSPSIGLVDLSLFEDSSAMAQDIIDYYFQLGRAKPKIMPYFFFVHELLTAQSVAQVQLQDMIRLTLDP